STPPVIEAAEFLRPIVVPPAGSVTLRVAAAVTDQDTVDVVIRSAETDFAADHFRARLLVGPDAQGAIPDGPPHQVDDRLAPVPLEPGRDLYGVAMFQGERFQRLRRYHRAAARHVDVDVATAGTAPWFASFLPSELLLGDPGMRDALMHGNQVCVPDATLLPEGIERIHTIGSRLADHPELRFCAVERSRDGDTYWYDIAVRIPAGEVVERWEGLRLRAVRKQDGRGPWVAPLLGSYLERSLGDLLNAQVAVTVEPDPARSASDTSRRRKQTELAAGRVLGRKVRVRHRPDGRPEVAGGMSISAAHGAGVTLCAASPGMVGCDLEPALPRPAAEWDGLLGPHADLATLIAKELGESHDIAATRVWTAVECLQKVGLAAHAPLTLTPTSKDGWLVFASGTLRVATLATRLRDYPDPVAFAILTDGWS
ncbi:MAG: polyketide synthase dehydratase domain-containing protein, partial [Micromonosporaceae bacterium]